MDGPCKHAQTKENKYCVIVFIQNENLKIYRDMGQARWLSV